MAEQTVFDTNFTLDATSNVFIIFAAKQGYSNGTQPWRLNLYYDENLINYAGGAGGYTDSPTIIGIVQNSPAANHRVRLSWDADGSMTLRGGNGQIQVLKK